MNRVQAESPPRSAPREYASYTSALNPDSGLEGNLATYALAIDRDTNPSDIYFAIVTP
jgi:hypothetical protein